LLAQQDEDKGKNLNLTQN